MSQSSPGVFTRVGQGITKLRNFFINTLFILVLVAVTLGLLSNCQEINVPDGAALVINPRGVIVDAATTPDPLAELLTAGPRLAEVELNAILRAIRFAASDPQIKMLVLDLDQLAWAAPAHAERIGEAIAVFQQAGKTVQAYGHYYSQVQYHIASYADALYMHPMGQIVFEGFGGFSFYFNELLEKFGVNVHVFRVGDYKSATEPLTRNDMSEESRMASETLYQDIWQHFLDDISVNRNISKDELQTYADELADTLAITQGDMARAALETHLVDELLTNDEAQVRMANEVGFRSGNTRELNGIDFATYLRARNLLQPALTIGKDKIAIIVAQGMIVSQASDAGNASAEELISLIRQAKYDPAVKAVVLRVDSPGGSQMASELIRQELELVQLAGKPVVASFGASAASGGYWIAATSDAIIAEPTSITGSIGIFSYQLSFEDTLSEYGVHTDGVGTTSITMGFSPFTGINEAMQNILQARIEHGYRQFIHLVARGRDMDPQAVEAVAQGRVWTGETAQELGLVDALGGLQTALDKAAEMANIDDFTPVQMRPPLDPRAAFIAELLMPENTMQGQSANLASRFQQVMSLLGQFDDPQDTYALCEPCAGLWWQRGF